MQNFDHAIILYNSRVQRRVEVLIIQTLCMQYASHSFVRSNALYTHTTLIITAVKHISNVAIQCINLLLNELLYRSNL